MRVRACVCARVGAQNRILKRPVEWVWKKVDTKSAI